MGMYWSIGWGFINFFIVKIVDWIVILIVLYYLVIGGMVCIILVMEVILFGNGMGFGVD